MGEGEEGFEDGKMHCGAELKKIDGHFRPDSKVCGGYGREAGKGSSISYPHPKHNANFANAIPLIGYLPFRIITGFLLSFRCFCTPSFGIVLRRNMGRIRFGSPFNRTEIPRRQ